MVCIGSVAVKHLDFHDPDATFMSGRSFSAVVREGQAGTAVKEQLQEGSPASVGDGVTIMVIPMFSQLMKKKLSTLPNEPNTR